MYNFLLPTDYKNLYLSSIAKFSKSRKVKAFYPKTFDNDSVYSRTALLYTFRILFFLTILYRFTKIIIADCVKRCKTFIQTHRIDLPFSVIFNIVLLFMLTFTLIWGFVLNINMSGKVSPLENITVDQFQQYSVFANDTQSLQRILSFAILFLVIESLLLLNT